MMMMTKKKFVVEPFHKLGSRHERRESNQFHRIRSRSFDLEDDQRGDRRDEERLCKKRQKKKKKKKKKKIVAFALRKVVVVEKLLVSKVGFKFVFGDGCEKHFFFRMARKKKRGK